jgi:hypothetical protein
MRKLKFNVVMYAPSLAALQKTLADKNILAEIQTGKKTAHQKMVDFLWNVTCPTDDYTTEQAATAVLKAFKEKQYDKLIDNVLIDKHDEDSEIVMVQHMELKFTVKEICNMAGI